MYFLTGIPDRKSPTGIQVSFLAQKTCKSLYGNFGEDSTSQLFAQKLEISSPKFLQGIFSLRFPQEKKRAPTREASAKLYYQAPQALGYNFQSPKPKFFSGGESFFCKLLPPYSFNFLMVMCCLLAQIIFLVLFRYIYFFSFKKL